MYIGAIADDLTGATDLALMLSRGGMSVLQVVGVPAADTDFGAVDAVVVSLKSRTIPAKDAVSQSISAADILLKAGAQQIFFKYCSTFDSTDEGNIGPVTEALMKRIGVTRTIACPAFPVNKRTVYKGYLFVGDQLLSESPMRDHPLTPMRDANLVRVLERQTGIPVSLISHDIVRQGASATEQALDAMTGIAVIDAISDDDLYLIGKAVRSLKLVTGGSGIALGLPGNFISDTATRETKVTVPAGHAVVLAGSCSAATRKQIAYAQQSGMPSLQIKPDAIFTGAITVAEAVEFAIRHQQQPSLIYSSDAPEGVISAQAQFGREQAGEIVENFLASVARELAKLGFNRFLVAGGETSGAVVSALDVKTLEIGPEIAPGVPWTRSETAAGPLALALKSGNFGDETMFVTAWELLG
ncbi:3-oxo-tetronate kinase [Brucella gallinifaecis]|uniref:3-oxo-tetronate kinase n=1 Tax=Brucella gallinifaecis TaxID=215590 RepID=A0A502BK88_9HYPH|nr:3-oxo-tetronate kinase [Brucella gallinifaecis]TPF74474.1 four-carbon acid sugar kinase family protein [Brucella gallinifaecis]